MSNLDAYKARHLECQQGPFTLFIEPTNHCNLACDFCPQKSQKRPLGFMSTEVFERLILDAKNSQVQKINLFFLGESLMHKGLFHMIRKTGEAGIQSRLNTNASFLNEDKAQQLLDAGLNLLTISFEGVNQEVYENLRIKGNYKVTLKNIQHILDLKRRLGAKTKITIEIIELPETLPYLDKFQSQMIGLGADQVHRKVYRNWVGYLKAQKNISLEDEYSVCSYPWRSMAVLWDGTFVPCCVDYDGKLPLGTYKEGIMAAWNSKTMQNLRQYLIFRKKNLKSDQGFPSCHNLCSTCDIPFDREDHNL
jgi:MoaA/NifB/PqqE/SkfB family radical SAM enzyme